MTVLIAGGLALLGAVFGSFAGATAWRLHKHKDIVRDRSECEHCHHKLNWLDLLPIASWLVLRGKCRYCQKPIGWSALLVELGLAVYFAGSFLVWPLPLETLLQWLDLGLWLAAGISLAILFLYDLRWYLLPDRVVYPLIILGVFDFILRALNGEWSVERIAAELVLALLAVAGLYGALYIVSKGAWIGFGDVKLGIFMGLMLGWQAALMAVFVANLIGCLVVIPGLLSGKLDRRARVPFGPFLIVGFVLAGLFSQPLIDWYLQLIII